MQEKGENSSAKHEQKRKEIHTAEVRRKEERNEDWMKTLTMCRHKEEKCVQKATERRQCRETNNLEG
jgi:hypothetical protein